MRLQIRSCCVVEEICWVCNSRLLNLCSGTLVLWKRVLSPGHGPCHNPVNTDALLVAYRNTVKEINITSKETTIIAQGFQTAFDISSAANKKIDITDVSSHKVPMLMEWWSKWMGHDRRCWKWDRWTKRWKGPYCWPPRAQGRNIWLQL